MTSSSNAPRSDKRATCVPTLRLEQAFGMEAQFWLNLQLAWDLYEARHSPFAREIARIKRHPAVGARRVSG
jgi:plasmid maintenance system antidote protein VapI